MFSRRMYVFVFLCPCTTALALFWVECVWQFMASPWSFLQLHMMDWQTWRLFIKKSTKQCPDIQIPFIPIVQSITVTLLLFFLNIITSFRCTVIYGTPTMYIDLLSQPNFESYDLSSLETGEMLMMMITMIKLLYLNGIYLKIQFL